MTAEVDFGVLRTSRDVLKADKPVHQSEFARGRRGYDTIIGGPVLR
jgi:hypothetical protein